MNAKERKRYLESWQRIGTLSGDPRGYGAQKRNTDHGERENDVCLMGEGAHITECTNPLLDYNLHILSAGY